MAIDISYDYSGNELTVKNTGAKVSFPYKIGTVLTYRGILVVLINPSVSCCTNLFGVDINGDIVWKIEYVQPWGVNTIFNGITLKDESLIACNKNGYTYYMEPVTGVIMYKENTENTNHRCTGNELTIMCTGKKVSFPSEINNVITCQNILIVLLGSPDNKKIPRTMLFGVHINGRIVWRIKNQDDSPHYNNSPFYNIWLENGKLGAWNGEYKYYIDPMTGKISGREYSR